MLAKWAACAISRTFLTPGKSDQRKKKIDTCIKRLNLVQVVRDKWIQFKTINNKQAHTKAIRINISLIKLRWSKDKLNNRKQNNREKLTPMKTKSEYLCLMSSKMILATWTISSIDLKELWYVKGIQTRQSNIGRDSQTDRIKLNTLQKKSHRTYKQVLGYKWKISIPVMRNALTIKGPDSHRQLSKNFPRKHNSLWRAKVRVFERNLNKNPLQKLKSCLAPPSWRTKLKVKTQTKKISGSATLQESNFTN